MHPIGKFLQASDDQAKLIFRGDDFVQRVALFLELAKTLSRAFYFRLEFIFFN